MAASAPAPAWRCRGHRRAVSSASARGQEAERRRRAWRRRLASCVKRGQTARLMRSGMGHGADGMTRGWMPRAWAKPRTLVARPAHSELTYGYDSGIWEGGSWLMGSARRQRFGRRKDAISVSAEPPAAL
jgi:hypothetical protein